MEEQEEEQETTVPFWAVFPRRARSPPPCGRARRSTASCSVSGVVCVDDGDGGGVDSEAEIAGAFLCGLNEDYSRSERKRRTINNGA